MTRERISQRFQNFLKECLAENQTAARLSDLSSLDRPFRDILAYDNDMACIRTVSKIVNTEMANRLVQLSHDRNSRLPINQLPPEILLLVLENSLRYSFSEKGVVRRLLSLGRVCRRWKDILNRNQSLWSWIDDFKTASLAIVKSQNAPLTIKLTGNSWLYDNNLKQALSLLLAHNHRLVDLRLFIADCSWDSFHSAFKAMPMSRLRRLDLERPSDHLHGHRVDIPVDWLELEHLELRHLIVSWEAIAKFKKLRCLSVSASPWHWVPPSRDELWTFLSDCSQLEDVTLRWKENSTGDPTTPLPVLPPLHLPQMKYMALYGINHTKHNFMSLLENTTTPSLTELRINVAGDDNKEQVLAIVESLNSQTRTQGGPLQVALTSCAHHQLEAFINEHIARFSCHSPKSKLWPKHVSVEFYLPSDYDGHNIAMRLVPGLSKCNSIPLQLELSRLRGNYEAGILAYGTSLRVISLEGAGEAQMMELIHSLGKGPIIASCPNLQELRFDTKRAFSPSTSLEKLISDLKQARPAFNVVIPRLKKK